MTYGRKKLKLIDKREVIQSLYQHSVLHFDFIGSDITIRNDIHTIYFNPWGITIAGVGRVYDSHSLNDPELSELLMNTLWRLNAA